MSKLPEDSPFQLKVTILPSGDTLGSEGSPDSAVRARTLGVGGETRELPNVCREFQNAPAIKRIGISPPVKRSAAPLRPRYGWDCAGFVSTSGVRGVKQGT